MTCWPWRQSGYGGSAEAERTPVATVASRLTTIRPCTRNCGAEPPGRSLKAFSRRVSVRMGSRTVRATLPRSSWAPDVVKCVGWRPRRHDARHRARASRMPTACWAPVRRTMSCPSWCTGASTRARERTLRQASPVHPRPLQQHQHGPTGADRGPEIDSEENAVGRHGVQSTL